MPVAECGCVIGQRRAIIHCACVLILALLTGVPGVAQTQAGPTAGSSISIITRGNSGTGLNELEQARRLLSTSNWNEAGVMVERYLHKNPDSTDAHALMGLILYRRHQPRASMAEFLRASEIGDLTPFDLRIVGLDCAAIPDFPEAEKWLKRSLEMDGRDAGTWEALGHVRFSAQQYAGAIEALERSLQLAPRNVSAEALIGLANERLTRPDAAEAAYRQAIQWQAGLKARDSVPYLGLGRVLLNNNQADAAIPWLQQAAAGPQSSSEAHELLGLAYSKVGKQAQAVTELTTAVRLQPETARLHLMLARAYRATGAKDKADAELARYTALKASAAE